MSNKWQKVNCRKCDGGVFFYSRAPKYSAGEVPCFDDCVMPGLRKATIRDYVKCSNCGNYEPLIKDIEIVSDPEMIRALDSILAE